MGGNRAPENWGWGVTGARAPLDQPAATQSSPRACGILPCSTCSEYFRHWYWYGCVWSVQTYWAVVSRL